ncbi:MAG: DUF2279 domain-containing protein [Bacteroidales bacterium]|nr:DUF2279 domain-containing protein [Bacteroidales bacterium]MDI9573506.1 DUF2279 domain-containing protein [Bacteroidota bacterium]OQC59231.1 MAG: hypothetical protein BWX51_01658 [Bacteroidetes bacterium ADurb.Bin012]MBP9512417.1 DUF2279 domain-containing protein [Bacteroidales bacterium]MBP9588882.1 DUF2279 domain-containing protein [Bacteroidales bacterium]
MPKPFIAIFTVTLVYFPVFLFPLALEESLYDSQDSIIAADTLKTLRWWESAIEYSPQRMRYIVGGGSLMYGVTLVGLNYLWYEDYPRSSFHFFDDSGEWLQVDKAGHVVTPYLEAYYLQYIFRWAGMKPKPAAIYAGITAFMLQNTIEVFDGFSAKWGASWSDVAANFVGSALMTSQELLWNEQRMRLKIIHHFPDYPQGELSQRARDLYGKTLPERLFKDYNALTVWLSMNPSSFGLSLGQPEWLNLAMGYGAANMYGGYNNIWTDENGILHDRSDIERYRRYFISPDIDFSRIKTKSRFLRIFFETLNIIKVPAPTLEINSSGQIIFHLLY